MDRRFGCNLKKVEVIALKHRSSFKDRWIFVIYAIYLYKSTGTLVTKFYMVRYPSRPLIKTSPWAVVFLVYSC